MACLRTLIRSPAELSAWRCSRSSTSMFVRPAADVPLIAMISSPVQLVHSTLSCVSICWPLCHNEKEDLRRRRPLRYTVLPVDDSTLVPPTRNFCRPVDRDICSTTFPFGLADYKGMNSQTYTDERQKFIIRTLKEEITYHHHRHIYFRLPERPQKPIELATIKQQKENCKNEKIQKSKKMILKI